jgi:hypothetical protein
MSNLGNPEGSTFRTALAANTLIPLDQLEALTRVNGVYSELATAQAAMLVNYLYRTSPTTLKNLFAAIDAGTVTTSNQAFNYILSGATGINKTLAELETAYRAHGAAN